MEASHCGYCGTPFEVGKPEVKTTTSHIDAAQTYLLTSIDRSPQITSRSDAIPANTLVLFRLDSEDPIANLEWNKIILGRLSGNLGDTKIVDLTPFGAERLGVSRHHVLIARVDSGYTVQDLNSTNGTWLNDIRLQPVQVYPLAIGALLQLGQLRLQAYYRAPELTQGGTKGP